MPPAMVIAHIAGVPVEEVMLPLVYGGAAAWLAARTMSSNRAVKVRRSIARLRRR
jgi:hypothetical protein